MKYHSQCIHVSIAISGVKYTQRSDTMSLGRVQLSALVNDLLKPRMP